jgi:predicted TIM-barrel fold metal-dependent hydrolase
LLRLIDENEISRACTLSAEGIFYDFIAGNAQTLDACRRHPQLIPVATVNPNRWLGCLEEARRLLDAGVTLFRFFPQYQEWHISEAPFRKLLDDVLAPGGAVLMLPAVMGISSIGALAKTVDNAIIIEGFRYDKLAEAIVVMDEIGNVYIETHIINSPNFVELLKSEVGVDRLVFGSYAPLTYMGAALAPIQKADVSEADKTRILGNNLLRILEGQE